MMQALQSGIPVVLTGMTKGTVELPKYPNKPIDFETGKTEKEKAEEKEEKQMQLQVAKMHEMMLAINSTFQRKQEAAEKAGKPKE